MVQNSKEQTILSIIQPNAFQEPPTITLPWMEQLPLCYHNETTHSFSALLLCLWWNYNREKIGHTWINESKGIRGHQIRVILICPHFGAELMVWSDWFYTLDTKSGRFCQKRTHSHTHTHNTATPERVTSVRDGAGINFIILKGNQAHEVPKMIAKKTGLVFQFKAVFCGWTGWKGYINVKAI